MEYKLPPLPDPIYSTHPLNKPDCYSEGQMEQYAEQAVAQLLAEIERLDAENKRLQDMIFNSW